MKMYFEYGSNQAIDMINYQQWRMAWYSYLDLLDISYEEGYLCSLCGQYPDTIICDATALAYKREYAQHLELTPDVAEEIALEGR